MAPGVDRRTGEPAPDKVVHVRSEVMDASDKERFNMKEHEQV